MPDIKTPPGADDSAEDEGTDPIERDDDAIVEVDPETDPDSEAPGGTEP